MKAIRSLAAVIVFLAVAPAGAQQSVESLMSTGQDFLQHGAYSQAVSAFKKALAREPDFFEARFNLGFAYLQWGNNNQAVVELKKAIKLNPRHSEAWSNLAIACDNLGRSGEAINALEQAVRYDPENMTARMNLAAMYANAKRPKEALVQYREMARMDPANVDINGNLARCLVATGAAGEAKEILIKVIAVDTTKAEPHAQLGDIYWKKDNDVDKAIIEFRTAVSLEPANPAHYQDLANALESKGEKKEAIEVWKKSIVYIDDVLNKEKIKDRIDRLEKSMVTTPGFSGAPGGSLFTEQKTRDLERELRADDSKKETKLLDAPPPNVDSDLEQMVADSSGWDLAKEAKRRAQDRKASAGK
jgi:tetratricopeptide (TPR) repeat protein